MVTITLCKHFHQMCPKYDILNPSHPFPPFRPTYLRIPLTTQQLFPSLYGRYLFFHFELTRTYPCKTTGEPPRSLHSPRDHLQLLTRVQQLLQFQPCVAGGSLRLAASGVTGPQESGDFIQARRQVSLYDTRTFGFLTWAKSRVIRTPPADF